MLLPRPTESEEEDDPRAELVRRLQEYEQFKQAAEDLDELDRLERDIYLTSIDIPKFKVKLALPTVSLNDLMSAFRASAWSSCWTGFPRRNLPISTISSIPPRAVWA
jgi:segregation and condensation protein A